MVNILKSNPKEYFVPYIFTYWRVLPDYSTFSISGFFLAYNIVIKTLFLWTLNILKEDGVVVFLHKQKCVTTRHSYSTRR